MLASTMQFSRYGRSRTCHTPHPRRGLSGPAEVELAPVPSGLNSVLDQLVTVPTFPCPLLLRVADRTNWVCQRSSRIASAPLTSLDTRQTFAASCQVLLRKEVIQPHLPVRLPCYDFVPIADPTLDGSLPYGLSHRLRVLPTFVT